MKLCTCSKCIAPIFVTLTLCKRACKVDCGIKSGKDPLPFWLCLGRNMPAFSQVLKPIKWQDLLEEGKMATMHFEQVQRFNLGIKYFGVRSTWIRDPYKILTSFLQDSYETFQDLTMILPRFYQHFSRSYKIYQDFTDILQDSSQDPMILLLWP